MEKIKNINKKETKNSSLIIVAALIMCAGTGGLLFGIGGSFSVIWMALAGFIALYILGDLKEKFSLKISIKYILLGLLLAGTVLIASLLIGLLLGQHGHANPLSKSSISFFRLFFMIIIPSLIGEEAFTATWLSIGEQISGGKIWVGVILSTFLFVAVHVPEYQGNFLSLGGVCGARLVFTWVALRKNSSFVNSSIVHIIYDTALLAPAMFL